MANTKKPANTFRSGNVKVTLWQNESAKGPFYSATFTRPYRDRDGTWHNAPSFALRDLEALMNLALEAKNWMAAQS